MARIWIKGSGVNEVVSLNDRDYLKEQISSLVGWEITSAEDIRRISSLPKPLRDKFDLRRVDHLEEVLSHLQSI